MVHAVYLDKFFGIPFVEVAGNTNRQEQFLYVSISY
jgi:hypothetical protein